MSNITTGFHGMPGASSREAPSFSDMPANFLTSLPILKTLPTHLWISLPKYDAANYKAFKAKIIDEYPGVAKGMQYIYHDLKCIVLTYAESNISTKTKLMEFSCQFYPVATWLVKNNKLSEHEHNKLFWQGLPKHICHGISLQLQLEDPKNFDYTEHPNFEKVIKDRYCHPSDAHQEVHTKTVHFDEPKLIMDEVDEISHHISHLNVHNPAYAGCYAHLLCLSTTTAEVWPPPAGVRPHTAPVYQTFLTTGSTGAAPPLGNCFILFEGTSTLPILMVLILNTIMALAYFKHDPDLATYLFQCIPIAKNNALITEIEEEVDVCAITSSKAKAKENSNANTNLLDKHVLAYTYESKAMNPTATKQMFTKMLDVIIPSIMVGNLLTISPDLQKEAVNYACTQCIPSFAATNEISTATMPPHVEYSTPLCELKVTINSVHEELALLDDGSKIVVICEDVWKASQANINSNVKMHMQTVNRGIQEMPGCLKMLEISVDSLKTRAHACVIPDAPYCLLLGCPWQCLVCLKKNEDDSNVHIIIHDPNNPSTLYCISTTARPFQEPPKSLAFLTNIHESISCTLQLTSTPSMKISPMAFMKEALCSQYTLNPIFHTFAYKKVADQVKPVATTMPQHTHILVPHTEQDN
ncbi:hypothetical protein J3A83DRAFT_4185699 [Scleroderma citrinum]